MARLEKPGLMRSEFLQFGFKELALLAGDRLLVQD